MGKEGGPCIPDCRRGAKVQTTGTRGYCLCKQGKHQGRPKERRAFIPGLFYAKLDFKYRFENNRYYQGGYIIKHFDVWGWFHAWRVVLFCLV